jgi:hypothetical protein
MKITDSVEIVLRKLANETRMATIDAILNLIEDAHSLDHAIKMVRELKRASLVEQLKQPIMKPVIDEDPDS